MWDIKTACEKVVELVCTEREKQVHCIVCDSVLFDYETYLHDILSDLEFRKRKIHREMIPEIKIYFFHHYPYHFDARLSGHHTSYKKNIQVPTCGSCHAKIHHRKNDPKYDKWKPIDKRPKRSYMLKKNLHKPLDVENAEMME